MFESIASTFSSVFRRFTSISTKNSEQFLQSIREGLLQADVPYEIAEQFIAELRQGLVGKHISSTQDLTALVYERVRTFLGHNQHELFSWKFPSVCMVMGLQGSGKTTTIAKLIQLLLKQPDKKPAILCASVDFYRPAAIDQLEILAKRVGCSFYRSRSTEPTEAARQIYEQFRQGRYDVLFLDTAGRMHVDTILLQELTALNALIKPTYRFLVLDGMIGQESLAVARTFEAQVGCTGVILSKMDSGTRGGVAFALRYAIKKPILFIGTGEHLDDIELFQPERMAQRMLDLGDIETLQTHINARWQQSEQERLMRVMLEGRMTLQDFADQLSMVSKLGSLQHIMRFMPGMRQFKVDKNDIEQGELESKRFRVILSSMTRKERLNHTLLNAARKQRIARGAGVTVAQVNLLLERFEQNRQFAKMFKNFMR